MTLVKLLSVATVIMMLIALGCGLLIRFGGDAFRDAVPGHMVLGVLAFVLAVATMVSVFAKKV